MKEERDVEAGDRKDFSIKKTLFNHLVFTLPSFSKNSSLCQ